MIGMITTGKSFYHCISYCLEDKRKLSEQQKQQLSRMDGVQHNDRAEVLDYNYCFGNKYELTEQLKDVRKLNRRVEKPVFHLSIRLADGEKLSHEQWREVAREAAKEFKFDQNQYISILHKDTKQPHIHIVGNRVGYDGKAADTCQSYRRMAQLCRRLEKQYNLRKVLNPRKFQSPSDKLLPRHDERKERLKENIRQILREVSNFPDFEKKIREKGYQVFKARGIAFEDDKKVWIKGSEVGFSLETIERILQKRQQIDTGQIFRNWKIERRRPEHNRPHPPLAFHLSNALIFMIRLAANLTLETSKALLHETGKIVSELLKPVYFGGSHGGYDFAAVDERERKKKKRLKHRR